MNPHSTDRSRGCASVLLLALLAAVPRVGSAAMRLVPEDYPTIQAALNVAVAGDEVSVAPGVYVENVSAVNGGVTLRSRFQHAATIQGTGSTHTVVFNNVSGAIRDFKITGAGIGFRSGVSIGNPNASVTVENNWISGNGSHGVSVGGNARALIKGNRITNNGLIGFAAGIKIEAGGIATVVNNYVSGNGSGLNTLSSTVDGLVIVNNTFVDNPSYGLFLTGHRTTIRNNIIVGSAYGVFLSGGFAADRTGFAATFLTIDHNLLWSNSVADYYAELSNLSTGGGGLSNFGSFAPTPGTGEVLADPLLDAVSGYRLSAGSPAVDAGNGNALPADTPLDFGGNIRLRDEPTASNVGVGTPPIDIGAHEYLGSPVVPALGSIARGFALTALVLVGLFMSSTARIRRTI